MSRFSVIIPVLNEEDHLQSCIREVRLAGPGTEIIVADGGSRDRTLSVAREEGAIIVQSQPGRGIQSNAGAAIASGEVLLFLHADTRLPASAFDLLQRYFENREVQIGTFRLVFEDDHWLLALYARFSRFDTLFTRFGDQCIVIRRSFFDSLGGFPDWPLFEDVALLQAARRQTRVYSFPAAVSTSSRRYRQIGIVRQQLQNLWLMLQYLAGTPPERLAEQYERFKRDAAQ